jgi:hypothetical protein
VKTPQALAAACAILLLAAHGARTCRARQQTVVILDGATPPAPVVRQTPAATPVPQTAQTAGASPARDDSGTQAKRAANSITGRVLGEDGEPLAGVPVYASLKSYSPGFRATQHMAVADDDGGFRINGLDPGIYSLSTFVPGYVPEVDPVTGRAGGEYKPGDTATVRLVKGGVITGAITDAVGQPVVALGVRAFRVRDLDGRPATPYSTYTGVGKTDDRGIYRIYGLMPGAYVVLAGGPANSFYGLVPPYQADAPTFYPSSTRDTALEVTVRAGQETTGVDLRYREEQGHSVTGKLVLPAPVSDPYASISLTLSYASSGLTVGVAYVNFMAPDPPFSFEGVPDGDYDLQATGGGRDGITGASAPQRVSVRGADVTGLHVTLAPMASVSGTLVVERASEAERARAECKGAGAQLPPQETLVTATFDRPASSKSQPGPRVSPTRDATPDDAGAFTVRALEAGRYRLTVRPFDENFYVRSVELPPAAAQQQRAGAATSTSQRAGAATQSAAQSAARAGGASAPAREVLDLRPGQQLSGVVVRMTEGAAALSGRVVVAADPAQTPPFTSMRVHLLPAEREHADDALRFFEMRPNLDGSFSFKNLPPGRYLLLARFVEPTDPTPRPVSWDADARAKLRREAEAANTTVELQPCQRTTDFVLHFPPPPR